jgi:transposase
VDGGYPDAQILVHSQARGIDLIGPVGRDTSWQARDPHGYDLSQFTIDWGGQAVTCPHGQRSTVWSGSQDRYGNEVIHVRFDRAACQACPGRERCTRGQAGRSLKLRTHAQHEALQAARQAQTTDAFRQAYRQRAGVEGTISQGVRAFGMRRTRYRGLAKTKLHDVLVATAMNLTRVAAWLAGERPVGTRISPFQALRPLPCT